MKKSSCTTVLFKFLICLILNGGFSIGVFAQTQFPGEEQRNHGAPGISIFPQLIPDDYKGFTSIFDGKTLTGWDGDTTFWRVENETIIGQSTPEKVVKENNFLIWRGGTARDFELKVDFRMDGENSGIQYRSTELPDVGKWVLKGYQADIDFRNFFSGNVHEERGRTGHVVLSRRGDVTRIVNGPVFKVVAKIGDPTDLRGVFNVGNWNSYHIIARGPILIQIVNGQLISLAIDEDTEHEVEEGLIGFQMHVGGPFKIEYRNIYLKKL